MAERTDHRPVQVFLDTRRFIEIPPTVPRPRAAKDFFQGNDAAFVEHKARMTSALGGAATALRTAKQPAGFLRVRQRPDALAKSHRPMNALFSEAQGFSLVGAETAGELLFQATPTGLDRLARIVEERAEQTPRLLCLEHRARASQVVVPFAAPQSFVDRSIQRSLSASPIWFEESGHEPFVDEPAKLAQR